MNSTSNIDCRYINILARFCNILKQVSGTVTPQIMQKQFELSLTPDILILELKKKKKKKPNFYFDIFMSLLLFSVSKKNTESILIVNFRINSLDDKQHKNDPMPCRRV